MVFIIFMATDAIKGLLFQAEASQQLDKDTRARSLTNRLWLLPNAGQRAEKPIGQALSG
jgi:hypothetical protein